MRSDRRETVHPRNKALRTPTQAHGTATAERIRPCPGETFHRRRPEVHDLTVISFEKPTKGHKKQRKVQCSLTQASIRRPFDVKPVTHHPSRLDDFRSGWICPSCDEVGALVAACARFTGRFEPTPLSAVCPASIGLKLSPAPAEAKPSYLALTRRLLP